MRVGLDDQRERFSIVIYLYSMVVKPTKVI